MCIRKKALQKIYAFFKKSGTKSVTENLRFFQKKWNKKIYKKSMLSWHKVEQKALQKIYAFFKKSGTKSVTENLRKRYRKSTKALQKIYESVTENPWKRYRKSMKALQKIHESVTEFVIFITKNAVENLCFFQKKFIT